MPKLTVARPNAYVKLTEDMQAQVRHEQLLIQHRATLIAAMDLTDAIKVARMVLARAEYCGIDLSVAASDVAQMDDAAYDEATDFAPIFA